MYIFNSLHSGVLKLVFLDTSCFLADSPFNYDISLVHVYISPLYPFFKVAHHLSDEVTATFSLYMLIVIRPLSINY